MSNGTEDLELDELEVAERLRVVQIGEFLEISGRIAELAIVY